MLNDNITMFDTPYQKYLKSTCSDVSAVHKGYFSIDKKTGRSVTLDPMNAYERRIIHAQVQGIEGVSTNSVGSDSNRRVVIYPEGTEKPTEETAAKFEARKSGEKRDRRSGNRRGGKKPSSDRTSAPREAERPVYKRPADKPRPQPRKIEKAKDLDAYFAKLKEFSSNNPQ